jgi:hypothetical protein
MAVEEGRVGGACSRPRYDGRVYLRGCSRACERTDPVAARWPAAEDAAIRARVGRGDSVASVIRAALAAYLGAEWLRREFPRVPSRTNLPAPGGRGRR